MKVFFISTEYPPCKSSSADYVSNLCQHFKWKSEIDPYIITSVMPNIPFTQVTDDGIYIFRIMEHWGIKELNRVFKLIKKENPEVIHIQYNDDNFSKKWMLNILPFLIKKYRRNIKIISSLYNVEKEKKLNSTGMDRLLASSDIVIAKTDYDFDVLVSLFPHIQKKVKKIYVRPNIIYNPKITVDRDEVRKRLKLQVNGTLISYFGFINKDKGLEFLFRALRQVLDRGHKTKLLIIGEPDYRNKDLNAKYNEDLKKLSYALNIESEIFWAGYCSPRDISMCLLSSDMAILPFMDGEPCKHSSFWSVLDHGVPTISTFNPSKCLPEGIKNEENVILIPRNKVDELALIITKYIQEPELLRQLGERGKKLVDDRYSWENVVNKLISIYKENG
ncbi:glycosyltransferase family 4 protein [Candidatus Desantisbacteria bacterium]|nr:glycosyltransferase family 4 protein [Candidatus Desantisbacteria bacterium]